MRFIRLIFVCLSLILLLLTAFLSLLRQHEAQPPYIFFHADEASGGWAIYRMRSDGSKKTILTYTADETFLLQTLSDGQLLYSRPPNYFCIKFDGSQLKKIHEREIWGYLGQVTVDRTWFVFDAMIDSNREIYRSKIDGSHIVNLTTNKADDYNPQISPDGKWVLFTSDRDGNEEIYQVSIDGKSHINLTQNTARDIEPVWSPDGKWILFISYRYGGIALYKMRNDGLEVNKLISADPSYKSNPAWSPNGEWIIFSSKSGGNEEIYKIKADGSNLIQLTESQGINRRIRWLDDGSWILFVSNRSGKSGIYKMRPDGSEVTYLADGYDALWSPIINMSWKAVQLLAASFVLFGLVVISYKFTK